MDIRPETLRTCARKLSKVLDVDAGASGDFAASDLPAMLRHQMAAPLAFDLQKTRVKGDRRDASGRVLSAAARDHIECFADLLFHRKPPLELLNLSKIFFKSQTQQHKPQSAEWRLAYSCYILSIASAGVQWRRISKLSPKDFMKCLDWAASESWIDEAAKSLLANARTGLLADAANLECEE